MRLNARARTARDSFSSSYNRHGKKRSCNCGSTMALQLGQRRLHTIATENTDSAIYRDFGNDGLVELRGRAVIAAKISERIVKLGQGYVETMLAHVCVVHTGSQDEFVGQRVGVTNFDYLLAETLYSGQLPRRSMLVIDEAHDLEQTFLGLRRFRDFTLYSSAVFRGNPDH